MYAIILVVLFGSSESTGVEANGSDFQDFFTRNLRTVHYLSIQLRRDVKADGDNGYVHFLLKQSVCPVVVSSYSLKDALYSARYRKPFAIVTDFKKFKATANLFSEVAETLIFIVSDVVDFSSLEKDLQKLWQSKSITRLLLFIDEGVFFYHPFIFNNGEYGRILPFKNNDFNNMFKNLYGYPMELQIFRSVYARPIFDKDSNRVISVDGVDGQVARALEKQMNFTAVLQKPAEALFGRRSPNGTYNGAIGLIASRKADISLTGFFIKDYLEPRIVFSVAIYDDLLCCYVPKAPRIPQSVLPIFAVHYTFWIGFVIGAFICGTIWILLRYVNLQYTAGQTVHMKMFKYLQLHIIPIYVDTCIIWVRVNLRNQPAFISERIYILSIFLVSVIFGAVIESSLATVYIHPMFYKDINTLEELKDSGFDIEYKFSAFKDDMFFSETSALFAALNKKLKYVSDLEVDITFEVSTRRDHAAVSRYSSLILEATDYIRNQQIHLISECPKYYTIAYLLPTDSPFKERIDGLLLRLLSVGLVTKWINDVNWKTLTFPGKKSANEETNAKVLTLADLQLAFYVLSIGCCLAFISLGVEFYLEKKPRRERGSTLNTHKLVKRQRKTMHLTWFEASET